MCGSLAGRFLSSKDSRGESLPAELCSAVLCRVAFIDDHPLFRLGLAALFAEQKGFSVVAECQTGAEGLTTIARIKTDLVMLDLSLPDTHGLQVLDELKRSGFRGHVVMLSVHDDRFYREGAKRKGASAWISKETPTAGILDCVQQVLDGAPFCAFPLNRPETTISPLPSGVASKISPTRKDALCVFQCLAASCGFRTLVLASNKPHRCSD